VTHPDAIRPTGVEVSDGEHSPLGWDGTDEGLPALRLHLRAGGRLARPELASMRITGTVAEWESWTGVAFPESGEHVVSGAASVVRIDRDADLGTDHDPNTWVVHDLVGTEQRHGTGG